MTTPIAILGAGPAGLGLARLLCRANIAYTVFERDDSPARQYKRGGSLDVSPERGQKLFHAAGLYEEFRSLGRYDAPTLIADGKGKTLAKFGGPGENTDRPELDRGEIRDCLLNSIPMDHVRWGSKVKQVLRQKDQSMAIQFADGSIESGFRLVVGADGARSKARDLVTRAKLKYFGRQFMTAAIKPSNPVFPDADALVGPGMYLACEGGEQIIIQRLNTGGYYVAAGVLLPEDWTTTHSAIYRDTAAMKEFLLREHYRNWPESLTKFIKHSEGDFYSWPLHTMEPDELPWEHVSGVTLIGDAAHPTLPNGEGVNIALWDSLQLGQQIVKHGISNLDAAVIAYEADMFPAARAHLQDGKTDAALLFAPDTPRGFIKAMIDAHGEGAIQVSSDT